MHDVYEVLRAKEMLIEQVAREIEALRLVAPLLADDRDPRSDHADAGGFHRGPDVLSIGGNGRAG